MVRQLIICCDGTNNNLTGRSTDTNVTRLCELLDPDRQNQLLYYDPGVGNPGELPGATVGDQISRTFERLYGLVFGKGIYENIAEAYRFLMRNYQPGDQIFLYGFSRGAFTARSIGGMVTSFGILRPDMEGLVSTLLHVYFADREKSGDKFDQIRKQISELFASDTLRDARVWFVGVWDTVASVGAPLLSRTITGTPTICRKKYQHVCQALALDEHRAAFKHRPYAVEKDYDYAANGQSVAQQWFSGSHGDVGGGYNMPEAALSTTALLWVLQQSASKELRLREGLIDPSTGQLNTVAVTQLLAQRARSQGTPVAQAHSETYTTPWWALAGLRVRNPNAAPDGFTQDQVIPAQEHPSVEQNKLAFPRNTVWRMLRSQRTLLLALLLVAMLWMMGGTFLVNPLASAQGLTLQAFLSVLHDVPKAVLANLQLTTWQLGWLALPQSPTASLAAYKFGSITGALLVDFAFMVAYGYLVARATSWAFAKLAGLRRAAFKPGKWLNRLGMSACVLVLADGIENLLMFALLLTSPNAYVPSAEYVLSVGITLATLAKWLGLVGCIALVAWATVARPQQASTARAIAPA
jgi:Uncharacterized alpha/beta hydrolase domain (DUF2235)